MTTKHTDGPWEWMDNGGDVRPEAIYAPNHGGCIVATTWAIVPEPARKANAKLIAAAPELYEACKAVLANLEWAAPCHAIVSTKAVDAARAAIAKATP